MEKIRNLSIRKTIVLYMTVCLMVSYLIGAFVIYAAERAQRDIWWEYVDKDKYFEGRNAENGQYTAKVPRISHEEMNDRDVRLTEFYDFLQTYSILVISVIGTILSVSLFYRNKIKNPLAELTNASKMISDNQLDFKITYYNKDELGQLCTDFEKMRGELAETSRDMWKMVEEEKALRSAIAHDIRSPLAILRGYQEMLIEFIPEDKFDKDKTVEILQEGMCQIDRLNHFIESMRKLSSIKEREVIYQETSLSALSNQIQKNIQVLGKYMDKHITVHLLSPDKNISADTNIILDVADNLISNALRFAKQEVYINITALDHILEISVSDDGCGFTENTEQLTQAYYHSNPQDDLQHFGLGMYISRTYCEKHGGKLLTGNRENGGALVKAIFRLQ